MTPELAKPLCHHIGGDVINVYGPTETTVWSWGHCVSPNEDPISIGRPMANARFYVLDPYGQPVPVGVPGELYIAGPGVTRGYAERPDATAKAFIPDPFNPEGGRMYRTGDRVAARPDGVLDYLGRLDFQVKIRGFRVELSEIEAAITNASPGPVHAVVTAWSPSPTDTRLVAYIVPETASEIDTGALRAAVERTMPDYMVPQYFQVLDAFPKTASGKIDRKRLPEPNADAEAEEREIVLPRNDKEEQLFRIWGEVLGDKSVSRMDRFFARGGHSLLAMMLVGRIEKELGHRVPLRSVLTGALSDIADTLPGAGIETATDDGARIAVADRNAGGIAIAPSQEPLWIVHRLDPDNVSDHISFGWTLEGPLNGEALEMSVKAMMDRHESLRLSIEARKDGAVLRIEEAIAPPLHFQKLAATTDDETGEVCDRICKEFVRQPFDFSTAPLFRILVLECEPERHIVLMVFHHIIVDGVSLDVLIDELSRHYNAIVETGRPASLAPLKLDYADFAAWQRAELTGQRVADLKDFWKAAVAADLPPLELPTDRPRPPVQSYHGATTHCMLPEASLQKLRVESQAAGCSLYVAMMASLKTLFHRLTNQEHVVVGAPVALRENADLSDMVGMVLNTLPVHTRLSGDLTFADVLRRENASFLDALEHQALPFHRIVEAVSPPRDPSRIHCSRLCSKCVSVAILTSKV